MKPSAFFIYIHQSIMQLLLQVGHLKFPKSREITALGCEELDAAHPRAWELQPRVPALLPVRGETRCPLQPPGSPSGLQEALLLPGETLLSRSPPLHSPTDMGGCHCQLPCGSGRVTNLEAHG